MKKLLRKTGYLLLISLFTFFLAACSDNDSAEEAGEEIDEVITDTGNAIEDACEDVKETADAKDEDC